MRNALVNTAILTAALVAVEGVRAQRAFSLSQIVTDPIAIVSAVAPDRSGCSATRMLLADPAVQALWCHAGGGAGQSAEGDEEASSALDDISALLAMSTGEFELVVTRMPEAGQPLPGFVGRFRLNAASAARISAAIAAARADAAGPVEMQRSIGAIPTFYLRSSSTADAHRAFELALVGDSLVSGNHATDLEEVLVSTAAQTVVTQSDAGTSPSAGDDTAAPGPLTLPERSSLQPGAVVASLDWERIYGRVAQRGFSDHRVLRTMLGLSRAERVDITATPSRKGLRTTLRIAPLHAAGALSAFAEQPVRDFADRIPYASSAAIALVVDPDAEGSRGKRAVSDGVAEASSAAAGGFGYRIGRRLDQAGMHAEPAMLQALAPLTDGGLSFQVFHEQVDGRCALRSVAGMRLRNPGDALSVLDRFGLSAAGNSASGGTQSAGSAQHWGSFAIVGDQVVAGYDSRSISAATAAADAVPQNSKIHRSRRQRAVRALARLQTETAIAAFRVDLPQPKSRVSESRTGKFTLSGNHVGVVSVQPSTDDDAGAVHIEMLSSM